MPELRKKYDAQLRQAILDGLAAFEKLAVTRLRDTFGAVEKRLGQAIDDYFLCYDRLVQEMIAEDQAGAARLARLRGQPHADLQELDERSRRLEQARERLRGLVSMEANHSPPLHEKEREEKN